MCPLLIHSQQTLAPEGMQLSMSSCAPAAEACRAAHCAESLVRAICSTSNACRKHWDLGHFISDAFGNIIQGYGSS